MSLIAGIINRQGRPIPDSVCSSLGQSISRNSADEVISFRYASAFFAKIDIGAFGESGSVADELALSLLTGEPTTGVACPSRPVLTKQLGFT